MSQNCRNCNQPVPENSKFCPHCGTAVSDQTVICANCKTENPAQAKFCKNCGRALGKAAEAPAPQSAKAEQAKPFYMNSYFMIMLIALIAMVVATYYNYNLVNSGSQDPVMNVPQNQTAQRPDEPTSPPPDPAVLEETKNQLEQDPDNVQLNVQMGNLLFDSQEFEDAIPYYDKALELEPHNPDVIVDLGVCYFNLEEYQKAKGLFEEALTVNPNHVNALYNLGVVAVRLKEMDILMDAWSKLVEVAPGSPQAAQASQILDEIHSNAQQNQNNQ